MDRRQALGALAGLGALSWRGRLFAAPASGARLLVVFLRGGYDSTNVVAPVGADFYHEARPTLALGRPGVGPQAALTLDGDWGLHPALGQTIHPLYRSGQAAFVQFAGAHDLSRSHFETQNTIELGRDGAGAGGRTGFMNRLAAGLDAVRPISFTAASPLIFAGPTQVATAPVATRRASVLAPREAAALERMYRGTEFSEAVQAGFRTRADLVEAMAAETVAADRGAIPVAGFRLAARRIGRMMRNDYDLGFIDVGGWDTHVNQGPALNTRLTDLGAGIADLVDEIGPETWRKTVVVVMSEFGRTFRENGYGGTDHGHGGAYWVLGGSLKGGALVGEQAPITRAGLHQDRDLPVLNEYRAVLGGVLRRMYGLTPRQLDAVFPAAAPVDLRLL
jgi:uncharacterized protein (DUF1501 family)